MLKKFFINDLNANLLLYKRLLCNMKKSQSEAIEQCKLKKIANANDIYSHLTSTKMIEYLLDKSKNWREMLYQNNLPILG